MQRDLKSVKIYMEVILKNWTMKGITMGMYVIDTMFASYYVVNQYVVISHDRAKRTEEMCIRDRW